MQASGSILKVGRGQTHQNHLDKQRREGKGEENNFTKSYNSISRRGILLHVCMCVFRGGGGVSGNLKPLLMNKIERTTQKLVTL